MFKKSELTIDWSKLITSELLGCRLFTIHQICVKSAKYYSFAYQIVSSITLIINENRKQNKEAKAYEKSSNLKMLTFEHKMLMAQMIFNEKETLFGEFGPELTKVEKQEKWMEILVKLNSVGANLTDYKVSGKIEKVKEMQDLNLFPVK